MTRDGFSGLRTLDKERAIAGLFGFPATASRNAIREHNAIRASPRRWAWHTLCDYGNRFLAHKHQKARTQTDGVRLLPN